MSEIGKPLFDALKGMKDVVQAVAPGLQNFGPEVKAELSRLGTQGALETASALFGGNAFVPYGPGQYTPSAEAENVQAHGQENEHTRDGMER